MLLSSAVWASLVASAPAVGVGPTALGTSAEPQAIVGGEEARPGEFDAVVSFLFQTRFCTGTVIAPRLVLTAAHCLANLPASAQDGVSVRFGISAENPEEVVMSEQFGVFPEFCPDCLYERNDIAYIVLSQPVEIPGGFPTVITDQNDWDDNIGAGRAMTMVGFGQTSAGMATPGDDLGLGTKRVVDTHMRPHGDAGIDFLAGSEGIDTCDGDSGGPALVTLEDGTWAIAGVLSGGLGECGSGESVYSVPLPAMAWIRDETGIDLLPAGCENADCVDTSVPDEGCGCTEPKPSTPAAALVVVVLLGLVRRRR
jgi:uncharacterized protein (TIGR03382 family)